MQPDPHALQIYVDGSYQGDRKSGYAGHVIYPETGVVEEVIFDGFKESTINRMELAAVIAAMEWVRKASQSVTRVQIFSDSLRYVIENIPRAPYWQQNRWRNAHGRPIEHPDLWKRFLAAWTKAGVRIDFGWVRGKSTPILKKVDERAKAAARSGMGIDRGYKAGKIGRATKKGAARMFPARGQESVIRVCGSRTVGRHDENWIVFEEYNPSTNQCGLKYFAYAQPLVGAQLHRQRIFRVRMNANPLYPQILQVLEELPLPRRKKPASARPGDIPLIVRS